MAISASFASGCFPLMLSWHAGRAIRIHHHECGFDRELIGKFQPDEAWWALTGRFLICDPGVASVTG